jgi:hypothetical protein
MASNGEGWQRNRRSGGRMAAALASVLLAVLLVVVLATPGVATAVSMSDLFLGQTITDFDKLFNHWRLVSDVTINGGTVDLSKIDVTALGDDPLNPGVTFTASLGALGTPFGHTGASSATLAFSFQVSTLSGDPLIKDNSLLIKDFTFDAGPLASIAIDEAISDPAGIPLGEKHVLAIPDDTPNTGNPNHFDSAAFAPQSLVHINKTITVNGPGDNDGAFLTMFEQRFSQVTPVPEPTSLLLLGSGLAGILGYGWRRKGAA